MGRDIKDELNPPAQEAAPVTNETPSAPMAGIQIPVSDGMQQTLVDIVLDDFASAKAARDERTYGTTSKGVKLDFEKWRKELLDLYNSERLPKTVPWKFCSNRSLRIAKAIVDMLHARLFPSIANEELLKFKAENLASFPKLERIGKLMHWWEFVHSRIRGFLDDWVKIQIAFGDCISESSWEANPRIDGLSIQKQVTGPDGQPLMEADGSPSVVSSVKIGLEERTISKIYTRDKYFLQKGSKDIQREPVIFEDEFFYRDLEEGEIKGQFVNVQAVLREKLPFSKEGMTNLTPEEIEKIRDIKLRNQPVKVLKAYISYDADGDGFAEDIRVYVNEDFRVFLGAVKMTDITKSGRRPINFTKIESRLENVEENFGYGVLETVKELAEEIDSLFNQLSDANTLSIMMPGFYDPGGDLDAPALYLQPNKITPLSDPQRSIYFPTIQAPIEKLIAAIRLVIEFIERLTAASSYVLGRDSEIVGGSGTATRTNAIVGAANERFAIPAERLRAGAANIIRQRLDILQLNIPPGLEQRILGDDGSPLFAPNELSMAGISGEFDAYLLPDPSMGSKETEQQVAQMLYSLFMQNPMIVSNPTAMYRLSADVFKSVGKEAELYLGPAPDMDMVDDPEVENTLMIQGDFMKVSPQLQENHQVHIQKHMNLLQSPSLAQVPPHLLGEISTFAQQHIQQHMMMMQMIMGAMQKGKNAGNDNEQPEGEESGDNGRLQGPNSEPGMEQVPGPLGEALNSKREGESGGNTPKQFA